MNISDIDRAARLRDELAQLLDTVAWLGTGSEMQVCVLPGKSIVLAPAARRDLAGRIAEDLRRSIAEKETAQRNLGVRLAGEPPPPPDFKQGETF